MALKDILGQERPIEILKRSLTTDRLPHAYIFSGEDGIGKTYTAFNLAKAINCDSSAGSLSGRGTVNTEHFEIDACDNCVSCIEIDKGIHPDVLFIEPEGDRIKIDQIRMAQERFSLGALRGRRKVMIIDKAHMMNVSSANALLKTLEEPPSGAIIILLTSAPNLLPATVLSRCQKLPFNLLSRKVIEGLLLKKGFKEEDASLIASLSDGRIGNALQGDMEKELAEREIFLTIFGSVKDHFYNISPIMEGIAKADAIRLEEILRWGVIWFRDILVFKLTGDHKILINEDRKKEIEDAAKRLSSDQIHDSFRIIYDTMRYISLRANKQLSLEVMMIKLAETLNPPSPPL